MHDSSRHTELSGVGLWALIGVLLAAGLIEALNLGGAADRSAAANRAAGGSGRARWSSTYRIRPTTTRGCRLAGAAAAGFGALLLVSQLV